MSVSWGCAKTAGRSQATSMRTVPHDGHFPRTDGYDAAALAASSRRVFHQDSLVLCSPGAARASTADLIIESATPVARVEALALTILRLNSELG
jgi:hypothetical protein